MRGYGGTSCTREPPRGLENAENYEYSGAIVCLRKGIYCTPLGSSGQPRSPLSVKIAVPFNAGGDASQAVGTPDLWRASSLLIQPLRIFDTL